MKPLVAEIEPILDRAGELKILVLGDLILDEYLWGRVERISPEAPVTRGSHSGRVSVGPGGTNLTGSSCTGRGVAK